MSRRLSGNVRQVREEPEGASALVSASTSRRARNPKGAGARLREDLVAAAGRLLDDGGDTALTIRAAARAVGAAPQSVYLHFADREALLHAVLSRRFEELRRLLETAEGDAADPTDRLRRRCLAYCSFALEHPRRYRLLLDRQAPVHLDLPAAAFPGAPVLAGFVAGVRGHLQAARPDLTLPDDTLPDDTLPDDEAYVLATDLVATLHGAVLLRTGMPSFPWPPLEPLVERSLQRLAPWS
jgi:AcrR family transcriptional regulator